MKEAVKHFNEFKAESATNISRIFSEAPFSAINHLLFRCKEEELEISSGSRGPYGLDNYGQFAYAGITSFIHILNELKISHDMGHELFNNIRNGDWYL